MARAWIVSMALALAAGGAVQAAPLVPTGDSQVLERLSGPVPMRRAVPADAGAALAQARAWMRTAREQGDPRWAGRALALLRPWAAGAAPRADVTVALADAEQYLHEFGAALERLQALVAREPAQPQAWLMLATLHRLQGRYAESDQACEALQRLRVQPHAQACRAENQGLRGDRAAARQSFQSLLAAAGDAGTRGWLATSLAELEERAGRPREAEAAWRLAAAEPDAYALVGFADFLLAHGRAGEAWALLQTPLDGEALLLRRVLAAQRAGRPEAAALRQTLDERTAQAAQRGATGHEREQAWRALEIDRDPRAAVQAARENLRRQREPIDLLLLARSAAAAGDAAARAEAGTIATQMGLHDERLLALR